MAIYKNNINFQFPEKETHTRGKVYYFYQFSRLSITWRSQPKQLYFKSFNNFEVNKDKFLDMNFTFFACSKPLVSPYKHNSPPSANFDLQNYNSELITSFFKTKKIQNLQSKWDLKLEIPFMQVDSQPTIQLMGKDKKATHESQ